MNIENEILDILSTNPGLSGASIHQRLQARSRAARWFKPGSVLLELCGPSVGSMYIALASLEERGRIRSEWGMATAARGFRRPRHYFRTKE